MARVPGVLALQLSVVCLAVWTTATFAKGGDASVHDLSGKGCRDGFETRAGQKTVLVCQLGKDQSVTGYLAPGGALYYSVTVPKGYLVNVLAKFPSPKQSDLVLYAHDTVSRKVSARVEQIPLQSWVKRYETEEEGFGFIGTGTNKRYYLIVRGFSPADGGEFSLNLQSVRWQDGVGPGTPAATKTKSSLPLLHFPMPVTDDPYLASAKGGFLLDTMSNYRYIRSDLLSLLRHAVATVAATYPGTKPLGIGDISDRLGRTPALDVGHMRHPAHSHDHGRNADIAYYQTGPDNHMRVVCDAKGGSYEKAGFCLPSAAKTHTLDLKRNAVLVATLLRSPKVRVIGADPQLGPPIQAEIKRLYEQGVLTRQDYENVNTNRFYWGPGWPFHHHHMHVSLH